MYKDPYELPKLTLELTLTRFFVIIITLFTTLVIPAQLITYYQETKENELVAQSESSESASTGRVAGVSTENTESSLVTIPIINTEIDLESESGALIIGGSLIISIAIIILLYLLVDSLFYRKYY